MEFLEFLVRLAASINSVLPVGFQVEPNRRPDLFVFHEACQAQEEEHRRELSARDVGVYAECEIISSSEHHVLICSGDSNPSPSRVRDEPDLFFVTPPEARSASGTYVHGYFSDESPFGRSEDEEGRLVEAAVWVLDNLQDSLCEGTGKPWPNEGIAPVPSPHGQIADRQLRLWFEDSRGTVLTLPAIPLD